MAKDNNNQKGSSSGSEPADKTKKKRKSIGPGSLIGKKYRIQKIIGSGGMGTVYLAEDIKLGRKVAIKTLSESIAKHRDLRKRFLHEAKTLSRIEHQNICTIYETLDVKGKDYIVMQYVEGKGLDEIPPTAINIEEKIEIIYQVCLGLKRAHDENIIHRDVKPSNVRIDKNGTVTILDFGLAKELTKESKLYYSPDAETLPIDDYSKKWKTALTKDGVILGTIYYMSPEQARGEKLDNRSDIFSLGTVMFELLSGKLPYPEGDTISALFHIVNTEPARMGKMTSGIPRRLNRIIYKALEKDIDKRYQSIDELLNDLEKVRSELKVATSSKMTAKLKRVVESDFSKIPSSKPITGKHPSRITSAVTTISRTLSGRGLKLIGVIILLAIIAFIALKTGIFKEHIEPLFLEKKLPPSIIVVNKFETKDLPSEISEPVQFLIIRSLSQIPGIWFIDDSTLSELQHKLGIASEMTESNIKILNKHEGVIAYISGLIEKFGKENMIEIHPMILHIKKSGVDFKTENIRLDITPGEGEKSILTWLVDEISDEIIDKIDFEEAKVNFRKIADITTDSWKALQLYMQAEKMWVKRKTEETRYLLGKVLEIDKDFALAHGRFAELEKFNGNKTEALDHLKTSIANPEKLTQPDMLYFESLKAELELDYQKQMRLLNNLYQYRSLDWNTSYALAEAYFHRGLIGEAKQVYKDTLKLSPKFAQALNHLGYCLAYLGEHNEAIEILKRYKELDETYNAYDSLGDGYYYAGDYERAERYKKAALQKNSNVDWIYRSLADIYLTTGRIKESLEINDQFRRKAKRNKRRLAEAALQRGYIYLLSNEILKAKDQIELARTIYGEQEIFKFADEMQWLSGIWYIYNGQTQKAREDLEYLRPIVEKNNVTSNKYFTFYKYYLHLKALCEYNEGKTGEARKTMDKLVNLGPKLSYWITFYHYGYFLVEAARLEYEMKNYDAADNYLEKALRYTPNYPYAIYYKAKIAMSRDNNKKASEYFEEYLNICHDADENYPTIIEVKKLLADIKKSSK